MLTLLMTGFAGFVLWALWVYIVRPALEDFGVLAPPAAPHILSSCEETPDLIAAHVTVPAPRSDAVPATSERPAPVDAEPLRLSKEDVIRALATLEILDSEGKPVPTSVKQIARFVGMRDQDVSAIVKEVRGTPDPPKPAAPFEELTKDGRRIAAHLRTKARAS